MLLTDCLTSILILDNNQGLSPQERFECSLGADPEVRVTYHPKTKKMKTIGSLLSTKSESTCFTQKITVQNTRLGRIPRLHVREQVLVSTSDKVRINLLDPKALIEPSHQASALSHKGIRVRWIRSDGRSHIISEEDDSVEVLNMEGAQGLSECEIGPGESVGLVLAWETIVPVGTQWYLSSS